MPSISIPESKHQFEIKDDWSPGARIRSASNSEKITESIFQSQSQTVTKVSNFKLPQNKNPLTSTTSTLEYETMQLSSFEKKVSTVTRKSIFSSVNTTETKDLTGFRGSRIAVSNSDDSTPPPPPPPQRIRSDTQDFPPPPPPPPQRDRAFTADVPPPPPSRDGNYDHVISLGRAETVENIPPPPPPKVNTSLKVSQPLQATGSKYDSTLSMTDAPKPAYVPVAGVIIGPQITSNAKPPPSLFDPSNVNGPPIQSAGGPPIGSFTGPPIAGPRITGPPVAGGPPILDRASSSTPLAPRHNRSTSNADGDKNFSTPLSPASGFSTPLKPGLTRSSSANNLQDAVKNPAMPKSAASNKPQNVPKAVLPQFSRTVSHLVASDNELSHNADVLKAFGDTAGAPPPLMSKKFTEKQYRPMDF